jgi:predicted lipoprotein with Yx(FWY)xxD motif
MRQTIKIFVPAVAATVLLAACGSSSSTKTSSSAASTQPATTQTSSGGSTSLVKTAANAKLGATVLVDAQGMTLYHLSAEQNGKFICASSACTQIWHPVAVTSGAKPSGSVGSLATIKRPDGTDQVTYKGMPLYTFAQDQPGDANGQGIKDVGTWNAVTTSARAASSTSASSAPASSSQAAPAPSSPYGY